MPYPRRSAVLAFFLAYLFSVAVLPLSAQATDRVMLLGDSWAILSGPIWNDVFAANGYPDITVVNPALGGILARDVAAEPDLIPTLLADNPDVEWLMISLGGNDLLTDWGEENEQGWVERLENAYRTILDPVIDARPDLNIVFLGYDFVNFEMNAFCIALAIDTFRGLLTPQINAEFLRVSEAQLQMAVEYSNVRALGLWGTMQAAGGIPDAPNIFLPSPAEFMSDCIHLTTEGYEIFAQAIFDAYFVQQFACTTDADGDGYTDHGCGGVDCDDGNAAVNPGAEEIVGNGIDDDCRASTSDTPPQGWSAASHVDTGVTTSSSSGMCNAMAILLVPLLVLWGRKRLAGRSLVLWKKARGVFRNGTRRD